MQERLKIIGEKKKGFSLFFFCTFFLVFLDQWTKKLAILRLKGQPAIEIWKGIFELRYLENRGAAFGMLQGRQFFFFLIAAAVFVMVVYALYRMPFTRHYVPLGSCMILLTAGAAGNMADRIRQQFVVDFFYFRLIDFPIFNVADCYVTVSAFMLIVLFMWYYKEEDLAVFSFRKEHHEE